MRSSFLQGRPPGSNAVASAGFHDGSRSNTTFLLVDVELGDESAGSFDIGRS